MNTSFSWGAALAAASTLLAPAFSAVLPVASEPSAVTVYLDRAILTRTAQVDLPAGQSDLVFENLPATLLDASLQVSGRGAATLLDVNARTTFTEASLNPRIKALEDELLALRRSDTELVAKLALVDEQKKLLSRIETAVTAPPSAEAPAAARPSFDDWQKLLTFQADTLGRLAADQQTFSRQRQELSAKIAATDAQLKLLRGQDRGGRSYKSVTVRVTTAQPGRLDLSLAYAVPGASWTPAYDARLRAATRAVELTYYGVVRNNTGEDWKNLPLTLSTARPSEGGAAPVLPVWVVDAFRPVPLSENAVTLSAFEVRAGAARKRESISLGMAAAPSTSMDAAAVPEAKLAQATIESAATSATFKVATPVTLPSDNTPQKVAIHSARLDTVLRYDTAPKLAEAAFLSAAVTNTTEFPLLAGPVNSFLDDTFVATSAMKTVMPTEKFDLALGVDDGIAVKRRLVNRFTEDTGLTSRGRRITYEVMVTVTNNKSSAERVVVKEPLPQSRDEKIVVKLLTPAEREIGAADSSKELIREQPENRLVWRLDLKPGEKRELRLKFSIEHPADLPVSGVE